MANSELSQQQKMWIRDRLHLMRKQNAQAGSPMPSIKIITQQIRRASEYDLPIFGAVFQRSICLLYTSLPFRYWRRILGLA